MKKLRQIIFTTILIVTSSCSSQGSHTAINKPVKQSSAIIDKEIFEANSVKCKGSRAIVFLIDKSRSVVDEDKIGTFKYVVDELVDIFPRETQLGVIGFDIYPFLVVRLKEYDQHSVPEVHKRIGFLFPSKGTSIVATLDEAKRELAKSTTQCKDIIVLSDGFINNDSPETLISLVSEFSSLNVRTSIGLLSYQPELETYETLHKKGGGFFIRTKSDKIFAQKFKAAVLKMLNLPSTIKK